MLLKTIPFKTWHFRKRIEDDLDERRIDYIFDEHGMSVVCDGSEVVDTIFLYADEYGGFQLPLFEIPLSLSRKEVRECFGAPELSSEGGTLPVLGPYGPWDRFARGTHRVHVEYMAGIDRIKRITVMLNRVVPT